MDHFTKNYVFKNFYKKKNSPDEMYGTLFLIFFSTKVLA